MVPAGIKKLIQQAKASADMIVTSASTAVVGVIAALFGLALFRCIGLFGRHNAKALFPVRGTASITAGRPIN